MRSGRRCRKSWRQANRRVERFLERDLVAILKKFFRCCGENVPIETGFRCGIFKANHAKSIRRSRPSYGIYAKPVTVGDCVWFGANVTVLPIGENTIVGQALL